MFEAIEAAFLHDQQMMLVFNRQIVRFEDMDGTSAGRHKPLAIPAIEVQSGARPYRGARARNQGAHVQVRDALLRAKPLEARAEKPVDPIFRCHPEKSIAVGGSSEFELVDGKDLTVKVEKPKDENGRVGLTIKSPDVGSVTYTCACDKFFPIVTPHKTKTGETLIVVVMAKPCTEKK